MNCPVGIKGSPNPIDTHVGSRLRLRRTLLGMSQQAVGEAVGLTFQQIQKYERGTNRISASRLWQFAELIDVPVSYFFDNMPSSLDHGVTPSQREGNAESAEQALLTKRETLEFVRAYYRITEPVARKRLFELTKAIARSCGNTGA